MCPKINCPWQHGAGSVNAKSNKSEGKKIRWLHLYVGYVKPKQDQRQTLKTSSRKGGKVNTGKERAQENMALDCGCFGGGRTIVTTHGGDVL